MDWQALGPEERLVAMQPAFRGRKRKATGAALRDLERRARELSPEDRALVASAGVLDSEGMALVRSLLPDPGDEQVSA